MNYCTVKFCAISDFIFNVVITFLNCTRNFDVVNF